MVVVGGATAGCAVCQHNQDFMYEIRFLADVMTRSAAAGIPVPCEDVSRWAQRIDFIGKELGGTSVEKSTTTQQPPSVFPPLENAALRVPKDSTAVHPTVAAAHGGSSSRPRSEKVSVIALGASDTSLRAGKRLQNAAQSVVDLQTSHHGKGQPKAQGRHPTRAMRGATAGPLFDIETAMAASLHNVLESVANILCAESATVFVRRDREMVAIAMVGKAAVFPPQRCHQQCADLEDSQVFASGIAFNSFVSEQNYTPSSCLIFPVTPPVSDPDAPSVLPVATVNVQNKYGGQQAFDEADEGLLLAASQIIGELIARIPTINWLTAAYNPTPQHSIVPFVPFLHSGPIASMKAAALPRSRHAGGDAKAPYSRGKIPTDPRLKMITGNNSLTHEEKQELIEQLNRRMYSGMDHQVHMIRRKRVVPSAGGKDGTRHQVHNAGLTVTPTLREVDVYVSNLADCWGKAVSTNVSMVEAERQHQDQMKQLQKELKDIKAKFLEASEELRLLRLSTGDYRREYESLETELKRHAKHRTVLSSEFMDTKT